MKLSEHLKPGVPAEISTAHGTLALGGKNDPFRLQQVDDDEQVLHIQTTVQSGRMRGQKALMIVPYSAILTVTVPL